MVEQLSVSGKTLWIRVDAQPANRENPNVIPTEYFTAAWFENEPADGEGGEPIRDEDGSTKLFESPVAALSLAQKILQKKFT